MRTRSAVLSVLGLAALTLPVAAQVSPIERGSAIATRQCSRCHAIGRTGESPMRLAPPFRDLSKRYPIDNLAEAFAEGIVTGHPAMPRFTFEPREIDALLAFIDSLTLQSDRRP
jgi:mono/diheme cytochrome c family protein